MKVIVAAAGTGGHINPAIAIANKIKQENKDAKITFIGTDRGLENDLVPRAGYELERIEAYGFSKKINMESIKNNIKTLKGISQAKKIVKRIQPDIIIGTGGYICGPVMVAAKKYKVPSIIHESNAFPGAAVKLASKIVSTVLVGFGDAIPRLPKAKNIVITGTPTKIRKISLTKNQKNKILTELGLKESLPIILIYGGSQGAKRINEAIIDIIKNKKCDKFQIIWATGPKQFDIIKEELKKDNIDIENIENMKILPYIYNMEEMMNLSDLIVARSGAMTITEVSIVGKPAIFIPLPNVSQNHQEYNAKVLESVGAAKIILDKDLNSNILVENIQSIILDEKLKIQMGKNAEKIAVHNVEDRIYEEITKLLK